LSTVKFNMKLAMQPLEEAQKRLVSVGLQLERDIKQSISGPGPAPAGSPPGVDTGRLRASISTNWSGSAMSRGNVGAQADISDGVGKPEEKNGLFRVVVGTNVEYAPWLEYGTRRMSARPFIRPAFDALRIRIAKMITESSIRESI